MFKYLDNETTAPAKQYTRQEVMQYIKYPTAYMYGTYDLYYIVNIGPDNPVKFKANKTEFVKYLKDHYFSYDIVDNVVVNDDTMEVIVGAELPKGDFEYGEPEPYDESKRLYPKAI